MKNKHHQSFKIYVILFGILLFSLTTSQAQYYWVGGAGNWSDLEHWATTSGGNVNHTNLPTKSDDIYIDENSFSGPGTISIDTTRSIRSLICSNDDENVNIKSAFLVFLEIYGDLNLTGIRSDAYRIYMYCEDECQITIGPEYAKTINLNGGGIYNMNSGGNIRHFRVHNGILNTNNHDFEIGFDFSLYDNAVANLGSSFINTQDFEVNDATVNSGTSTIKVHRVLEGNNSEFYDVIVEKKANIRGNNSFRTLKFEPGSEVTLEAESTQTIYEDLILIGTSDSLISISTTNEGTTATLSKTSGTVDGQFLILRDSDAIGGATFNANESVDLGNNSGWNITESQARNFYWVGGTGDWNDVNHWAKLSGSSVLHNDVPGLLDDVHFDENSFSEDNQVVHWEDQAEIKVASIDCSGVDNEIEISGHDNTLKVYGSLIVGEKVNMQVWTIKLLGKGVLDLLPGKGGKFGDINKLRFEGDATWNIGSDINTLRIEYAFGTVNTQGYQINTDETVFTGQRKTLLHMDNSTYFAKDFYSTSNTDSIYIEGVNSDLVCEKYFSMSKGQINTIEVNINHLNLVNKDIIATIATDVSFGKITIIPGKEVILSQGLELTVNELDIKGTIEDPIKIHSNHEGMQSNIRMSSGEVQGEYLELKDIAAVGGATFWATNSVDLGNVNGWIFGAVATDQINKIKSVDVYPNPAHNHVRIDTESNLEGDYMVFDILGKQLTKNQFWSTENGVEIDVTKFDKGTYIVIIQSDVQNYKGKFVKI